MSSIHRSQTGKLVPAPDPFRGAVHWRPAVVVLVCVALLVTGALVSCQDPPGDTAQVSPTVTLVPTFTPVPSVPAATSESGEPTAAPPTGVAVATDGPTEEPAGATVLPSAPAPTDMPPAPNATATQPANVPSKMRSPAYGMQAFLWWRPEVAQRDLELIRDAGFGWVKQEFAWREIEGAGKGVYDWGIPDRIVDQVEGVGKLRLIARLDNDPSWASGRAYPNPEGVIMTPPRNPKDFADFCYAFASRYKGRIAAYQIWNEPNLKREWGGQAPDPAGYVELLKAGYDAIKRADPNAIVISAGLAPTTRWDKVAMPDTEFLKRMYAAGARLYFDVLGAHGAGYKAPPEADPAEVANDPNLYNKGDPNCPGEPCRIYCFRHVEDLRRIMVDNGDNAKRVVVLEFGWTIDQRPDSPYAWHAVTEEVQADYFVRAYQFAKQNWQPWIGTMSLIYMPNVDWTEADEQYWWSIAIPNYPQFYSRQAYRDLAEMPK